MKYLPQSAAAGFVLGIIAQRFSQQTYAMIVPLLALGGLFLLISIFLIISRKLSWFLTLISFFFLGWANTIYHSDTSRPGHLDHVISTNPIEYGVTLEGWIFASPDIRERYTIVPLQVDTIIDDNNQNYTIKRGKIYLKVYPSLKDKYSELAYGQKIRLTGVYIRRADPALNPGAFNMKRFLENQHYYAMTSIREPEQLMILKTGGGNPAMHIAQSIKTNLLLTIKQTVPFPESSFLGGVLLGLRSGLSNEVKDTFRAAGVSHVLAVSGLHVTIITLFFMALFGLIKIPRTTAFILIVVALILFTLITGARPSTVRAAIMNSVTLLFYYFRGFKLDRSFLLGICIAALAILIYNPLILTEAAFLFSFSAVLSLSLLTRPIWELACRYLRGAFRIILFLEILVAIAVWFVDPTFFSTGWAYEIVAAVLLLAGFILDRLTPQILEFRRLPNWISVFAAAQLSIQLGMLPLTAFYFKKISISAAMANFLAIPLIGVIVQLGLFAGILGQIPVIGMYLGLVLNASNWLAIKLFLGSADFFGTVFPYPSVSPPKTTFLIPYYTLLLMVAAKSWIEFQAIPKIRVLLKHIKTPAVRYRFAILGVIVLLWGGNFVAGLLASSSQLEIIFLIHPCGPWEVETVFSSGHLQITRC